MGAGYSDFEEIEKSLKSVLQDRATAVEKTAQLHSELKQRENEYQNELDRLLQRVEEQEKEIAALRQGAELQKLREFEKTERDEAHATLTEEFKRNISTLRGKVKLIKPGGSDFDSDGPQGATPYPKQFNVGIFGLTGVGKTSLLNSLKYAIRGHLRESEHEPVAPLNFQGGHTLMRYSVRITKHITFIDNRGIRPEDLTKGSAIGELRRQLEGKGSFTQNVDWSLPNPQTSEENEENAISSTILVFHACDPSAIGPHGKDFLEVLKQWQGQHPIAVITHVDIATLEEVQRMRDLLEAIGLTAIYEVANITREKTELEPKYQSCLLRLLERCIRHGDRNFQRRRQDKEFTKNE